MFTSVCPAECSYLSIGRGVIRGGGVVVDIQHRKHHLCTQRSTYSHTHPY